MIKKIGPKDWRFKWSMTQIRFGLGGKRSRLAGDLVDLKGLLIDQKCVMSALMDNEVLCG